VQSCPRVSLPPSRSRARPSHEVRSAEFRRQHPGDENPGPMQRMDDSSLRLVYDCRLSKIGSSAHRLIDPSEGHGVGFNGPMAKTVVSDWWRVASKEQSGELNHESQIANWRWKVANHKSKIGNRKSKIENDPMVRWPDRHGSPRCIRKKMG